MNTLRELGRPTLAVFGIALAGLIAFAIATGNWGMLISLPLFTVAAVLLVRTGQRR